MSDLEEYMEKVDLYWEKKPLQFKEDFKKNIDNFFEWKGYTLTNVYKYISHFSIEWHFLDEDEKLLYRHNSENYKRKYILLFEIELFIRLLDFLNENFENNYPVLWKDDMLVKNYFSNLYPKIKINIQLRNLLMDINRLHQYYMTTFEKKRILSIEKRVKELEKKIQKRFIPVESFMKLFYTTSFQKINSYDIRREVFRYL